MGSYTWNPYPYSNTTFPFTHRNCVYNFGFYCKHDRLQTKIPPLISFSGT